MITGARLHGTAPARPSEAGQVAGIEAVPFGLLVLVAGTLLLANIWAVVDARMAMDAAAREAVRSYVEAWPDDAGGAWAMAERRGREAAAAHGRRGDRVRFDRWLDGPYARCVRATVTAHYDLAALTVPFVGGFGHSFGVSSTHSEVIDPYRDGGPTGGGCG